MICKKCGMPTANGERACKQCGSDLDRGGGPAVMTARPVMAAAQSRPVSRLAAWFMGCSAAGLACMLVAYAIGLLLDRWGAAGLSGRTWNLGLAGLSIMVVGFLLLCSALLFGLLGALRLRQDPHLRGRNLMMAGALLWLFGAALFLVLRQDNHYHPPVVPLIPPATTNTSRN